MSSDSRIRQLLQHAEFQSALVRLAIWLFAVIYIGAGSLAGHFVVDLVLYSWLFGVYLVLFLGLLMSVVVRPVWPARRYLSLLFDISATSLTIYLTGKATSPFFLLYIWIFVSYGTRYGKHHLAAASVLSMIAYGLVLHFLEQWAQYSFEALFFFLLLMLLPLYEYSLLKRLHIAYRKAEQADRAKQQFLSAMSSELRLPLNGIAKMAGELHATPLTRDQREFIDRISSSAGQLNAMIGDALDLSKIHDQQPGIHLDTSPFEIRPLIGEVCRAFTNQALEKRLELVCRIDPRLPAVLVGDGQRVKQVIYTLLGNAIRYTDAGGVEIRARLQDEHDGDGSSLVLIEVLDTSLGIPPHLQERVFNSFWQTDVAVQESYGGTGLGSTVARDLVHLMGGEIGLRSSQGEGNVFWVRLPLLSTEFAEVPNPGEPMQRRALLFETQHASMQVLEGMCDELGLSHQAVACIGDLAGAVARAGEYDNRIDLAIICDGPEGVDTLRLADVVRQHLGQALPVLLVGYRGRRIEVTALPHTRFITKPLMLPALRRGIEGVFDPASAPGYHST